MLAFTSPNLLLHRTRTSRGAGCSSAVTNVRPRRRRYTAVSCATAPSGAGAPALRTCRVCKQRYDPTQNGPRACRSHPENYSGDSARKMNWESDSSSGIPSGEPMRFYWCCGADDVDALGCSFGPHLSYDD